MGNLEEVLLEDKLRAELIEKNKQLADIRAYHDAIAHVTGISLPFNDRTIEKIGEIQKKVNELETILWQFND